MILIFLQLSACPSAILGCLKLFLSTRWHAWYECPRRWSNRGRWHHTAFPRSTYFYELFAL